MNSTARQNSKGVALVIVLAFIALISTLVVAYFSSVTTEVGATRTTAAIADTRRLVDTAVDIVTAQIREATAPLPKDAPLAWASQPGMIRVFGKPDAASSEPYAYYKLYSSDKMVVTKDFGSFQAGAEVAEYNSKPELYVDLNKPVLVADASGGITVDGKRHRAVYPIFDPGAVGVVEGFGMGSGSPELANPPGGYAGTYPPKADYNPVADANPAPMPVKWVYVLRDGTLVTPTSASKGVSTFAGPNAPTKKNPIVGRVAFWTDDETSKVNINTASEGTFWDTPMTGSYADSIAPYTGLGKFQPTQNEYQRYPGHPFTVCLSPILGKAMGWTPPASDAPIDYASATYNNFKQAIYTLIPRVATGGSMSGSIDVTKVTPVKPDYDRLYASVDELLFKAPTATPPAGTWLARPKNAGITPATLQQVRFFLTANSRAPELNLFGRPRVSIWPVGAAESSRSAKDNVFAFASTIGSKTQPMGAGHYPFFFARSDAQSSTKDYADDAAGRAGRNMVLYKYLQDLTAQKVPGFGGSTFLQKYPDPGGTDSASDRDQILTEIFDYIRCVNLSDASGTGGQPFTPPYVNNTSHFSGQVTPIQIGNTRGFGRFPTVSEAVVLFSKEARTATSPPGMERMRATLLLEVFTPAYGYMGMKDTYGLSIQPNLRIEDPVTKAPVDLFQSGINLVTTGAHHGMHGRFLGGYEGFGHQFFYGSGSTFKTVDRAGSGNESKYPFVSNFINFPIPNPALPESSTFKLLPGGSLRVNVHAGRTAGDPIVQSLILRFPETPVYLKLPESTTEFAKRLTKRVQTDDGTLSVSNSWIETKDAVRSIEAKTDLRLIAARKMVQDAPGQNFYFGPTGDARERRWEADPTNPNAIKPVIHSLRTSIGPRYATAVKSGVLVAIPQGNGTFKYPNYRWDKENIVNASQYKSTGDNQARMADLPEEVRGVLRLDGQPGDWDNGVSKMNDGAYINKPDEGETTTDNNIPYYLIDDIRVTPTTIYSPNRIIASAGWFGSLPSGVMRKRPWETLLFRPDLTNHPGAVNPPDHLLMDLFQMPVVEPYPISEPFSTGGKINLNYQIMPFAGYMKRDTAMRALLRSEKILCIPTFAPAGGKVESYDTSTTDFRHQIDEETTLAFLERRWKGAPDKQVFRSASQVTELDLYPKRNTHNTTIKVASAAEGRSGVDVSARWKDFWGQKYAITGDNSRERPYARLYSRLTTKSNTYTVHLRVQSLVKRPSDSNQATWDENHDSVVGEYRGSAVVERYLDPADRRFSLNDATVPAKDRLNPDKDSLEAAYRYRVISTKQFVP